MMEMMSNETKGQDAATQTAAARQIDDNVGPCPECGSPVIQYADHFACSQALGGGCGFAIATAAIEATVTANVADVLLDAIIGGDVENGQLMSNLLDSPEKHWVTWHDSDHSIYEYYEMQLAKNDAGQWAVLITRDDAELAALAKEGYARIFE